MDKVQLKAEIYDLLEKQESYRIMMAQLQEVINRKRRELNETSNTGGETSKG